MPSARTSTRRFGIEMEGYFGTSPRGIKIKGGSVKRDMSLLNNNWNARFDKYGVEISSRPIRTYSIINRIFEEMSQYNWSTDERAGTHVHIEIADFDDFEKIKLLRFAKGIEDIILMFVKDYRNNNRYCPRLSNQWSKVFTFGDTCALDELKGLKNPHSTFRTLRSMGLMNISNGKYNWLNIYGSNRPTAEFRIFHAVESSEEAVKFVKLAHAIVDIVKNSTVEQLEFIIASLYKFKTIKDMVDNFYYAVGLDYPEVGLPLVGERAVGDLANRIVTNNSLLNFFAM